MPPTVDTSSDLLFGLLALQTGLINQAQLVAAFHAWTQARDRSMAEILAEQGALEAPCLTLVEGLVIEHLRRTAATPSGASPPSASAGRLASAWRGSATPNLTPRSPRSARARPSATATPTAPPVTPSATATGDGQRFRVLRPHAQGGLGAVFVALDDELHREVALKQILDRHADDPTSRQRFLLEAEITGGLEHPGIVPVYGLGTYADGRPYYAMRFIRGDSLKEAIERFHADERAEGGPGPPLAGAAQAPAAVPRRLQRDRLRPQPRACCTATSSRATSSSASTARRWSSTGAWPRRRAGPSPAPARTSGRLCPSRPAARPRRCPAARWARRPT